MRCALCGQADATFGDGHLCVADGGVAGDPLAAKPSSGWRVMSFIVIALAVAYVVACAGKLWLLTRDYALVDRLTAEGDPDTRPLLDLAASERAVNAFVQLMMLGYVLGFAVWFVMLWRLSARNARDPHRLLRHWTMVAWAAAILTSIALAFMTRDPQVSGDDFTLARDDLLAYDRNQIVFTVVRMIVGALLIVVVLTLRRRVRQSIFGALEAITRV